MVETKELMGHKQHICVHQLW